MDRSRDAAADGKGSKERGGGLSAEGGDTVLLFAFHVESAKKTERGWQRGAVTAV